MDRTLPFAKGIAAGNAAPRLALGLLGLVRRVDLAKMRDARLHGRFLRFRARHVKVVQIAISHAALYAARRRFSMSESIEAALGFTTQNFPM